MTAQLFAVVFVSGTFVFVLAVYLLSMRWRRQKYKEIAEALGAQFQAQGLANAGEIVGSQDGRKYRIETRDFGKHGMWTTTSVECVNRGISLYVYGGFFKTFPNWRYVSARDDCLEKAPRVEIALVGAGTPLEERYKGAVQSLLQEAALVAGDAMKKGVLKIESNLISFSRRGVVTNVEWVQTIVSQLAEVARRVESQPIV
jgi:hypothetical protein